MWPTALLVLFLVFQNNYYEQGLKALNENQYQAAVDDFLKAIEAEPQDYTLHFNLALAYSLLGKDADAIPQYKKVLELKAGPLPGGPQSGITLLRAKQAAEAVSYLAAAVAQKPKEYRPNYYLGAALLASDDFPKAEQAYTTRSSWTPSHRMRN